MPVRVRELASGRVLEVPPDAAVKGLGTEFELVDSRVRVIGPDGRTGRVRSDKIRAVLSDGFRLADDEQVAEQKLRNDANTVVGNLQGAAEQFGSGITLGGSDLALEALGVDPAGMRAREEALGAVGTAARIAGEVAPALLTGGGTAGARGAARFLPGVALDTAAARVGGRSLAVRGAIEGAGYGAGQQVHESVLAETDLNAEHLLAGGFAGAVLGGAAGAAIPGLAKLADRGSRKLSGSVEDVLTRLDVDGMSPGKLVAEAIAKGDDSLLERGLRMNAVPAPEARRIAQEFARDPSRFHTAMSQSRKLDDDLATLLRDDLNGLQSTTDEVIKAAEGAAKYRAVAKHIPAEARGQVLDRSADELYKVMDELDAMADENVRMFGKAYDHHTLREARAYVARAEAELVEKADPANAFEVIDRLKRDLGLVIDWNIARKGGGPMVPGEVRAVHQKLGGADGIYSRLRSHLEREDLFGKAAVRQRAVNEAATQDFNAQAAFRGENGNGLLGRIWNRETGEVNARTARRIAKQYGRSGPMVGDHLGDVLEARVRRLEAYAEHTDLPPELRARITEARATKNRIESALKDRSELASIVDDMEVVRNLEGNRSVSIGLGSTLGPVIGGTLGSTLGPLGTAAGVMLGQATRPYSAVRGMAGILAHLDAVSKRIGGATGRVRAKLEGRVLPGMRRAGRTARKAATVLATHADDREKTMERVRQLVGNPDLLDQALDVPTYDLRNRAPNLERIAAQKIYAAAQYLVQQQPPVTTTPFGAEMRDPVKEREFKQCYDATMDPIGVLELLPQGLFTRKHAHALQAVYPEIWAGAQAEVWEALVSAPKGVSLETRSSVGIALGLPTDVGLKPGMATELAMRHAGLVPGLTPPPAPGEAPGTKRPRKARAGDIKRTINTYKTPLERASSE